MNDTATTVTIRDHRGRACLKETLSPERAKALRFIADERGENPAVTLARCLAGFIGKPYRKPGPGEKADTMEIEGLPGKGEGELPAPGRSLTIALNADEAKALDSLSAWRGVSAEVEVANIVRWRLALWHDGLNSLDECDVLDGGEDAGNVRLP